MSDISSDIELAEECEDFDSADEDGEEGEEVECIEELASDVETSNVHPPTSPRRSSSNVANAMDSPMKMQMRKADELRRAEELRRIKDKPGPLQLIHLPVDVLRLIVYEVTDANDLNAVALTCSTLHALAIQLIYSRFDIVWPDEDPSQEQARAGVDALTYGLSTLALAEEVFEPAPAPHSHQTDNACSHCGQSVGEATEAMTNTLPRYRVGNSYGKYMRKFAIGNGPPQYIRDYTAEREAGKMLNTLVALAIGRCKNLEEFKWDMPTGISRDIWLALASLSQRRDGAAPRLRKVWIRLHDRRLTEYDPWPRGAAAPDSQQGAAPGSGNLYVPPAPFPVDDHIPLPLQLQKRDRPTTNKNVSLPARTFSLLPPLQSLRVLGIDSAHFLYEMSDLIARSLHCLKELRVSIIDYLHGKDRKWNELWEIDAAPDPYWLYHTPEAVPSSKQAGGPLGTLFGRFFSPKEYERAVAFSKEVLADADASSVRDRLSKLNSEQSTIFMEGLHGQSGGNDKPPKKFRLVNKRLALEVLELNYIPLSVKVLAGALDWSKLTSLTLLSCEGCDSLWKYLRGNYTPKPPADGSCYVQLQYPLALRRICTDNVTPTFIKFLGETLAPNSLQGLFLKESLSPKIRHMIRQVSLKEIFKGAIRRHAAGLRRLSIDCARRKRNGLLVENDPTSDYRCWLASRDVVAYLFSGSFPVLTELCLSIDRDCWHFLLRRLPRVPSLQLLYIPVLHKDPVAKLPAIDPTDLAYSVADAISFRPDIGLAYFGHGNRCYEIYETNTSGGIYRECNEPPLWVQAVPSPSSESGETQPLDEESDVDASEDDTNTDEDTDETDSDLHGSVDEWPGDATMKPGRVTFEVREIVPPEHLAEVFRTRKGEL